MREFTEQELVRREKAEKLREMGYNPIYYHIKNVNSYENGNAYKTTIEAAKKLNVELKLSNIKPSIY